MLPFRKINVRPNPLHLTMSERALVIDVLRSMERSVARERTREWKNWANRVGGRRRLTKPGWWDERSERSLRERVMNAALRQACGEQPGEGTLFRLERDMPAEDLDYIRVSFGIQREGVS